MCRVLCISNMQTHAWACIRMVENDEKHSKIMKFFFTSFTWASRTHDDKGTFFMIFECFPSFSTMRMDATAGRNTQQLRKGPSNHSWNWQSIPGPRFTRLYHHCLYSSRANYWEIVNRAARIAEFGLFWRCHKTLMQKWQKFAFFELISKWWSDTKIPV